MQTLSRAMSDERAIRVELRSYLDTHHFFSLLTLVYAAAYLLTLDSHLGGTISLWICAPPDFFQAQNDLIWDVLEIDALEIESFLCHSWRRIKMHLEQSWLHFNSRTLDSSWRL